MKIGTKFDPLAPSGEYKASGYGRGKWKLFSSLARGNWSQPYT